MKSDQDKPAGYLDGQMLIAMPSLVDGPFARSVVYLCAHRDDWAMGIIVNQSAEPVRFPELLVQLGVVGESEAIQLPPRANEIKVLRGGPVETGRGFVLHSGDFFIDNSTLPIGDNICLTATIDILRAIAKGSGPEKAVLALGYAGWSSGQLESEIRANGWLLCAADPGLVFDRDFSTKYDRALAKIGVDPGMLASEGGRA
ncbi:MAG TPA: YqgE/AlgH family protein [Roseiarcus sp.]|nr:YqgE/AlgH family protein [Roseiarcus sp.]